MPKVNPPRDLDELRPISNLFIFNKIQEELVAELVVLDMQAKLDPSQYGNIKKTFIQHYLIKMLHQILAALNRNSKGDIFAACVTLYDYKQAFSRQSHKLGVQSFLENGVRAQLIPALISYFQGRTMQVKWRGLLSTKRHLPGSGAQGSFLGNWEYLSQTNNNADCVPVENRWKWVDDLTTLEIINLITLGMSSYNFKQHVASDIGIHGQYIDPSLLKNQNYINTIDKWSAIRK